MLGFVQNLLASKANPIGVDFGSDTLRLAQVQRLSEGNKPGEEEYKLVAAASADVPSQMRKDPAQRLQFFVETTRDLLAQGKFRGRQAILALPVASMYIQHLRTPKMGEEELKKALPWEARGQLPIDPSHALLRHVVAGDIHHDQEPKSEVILFAAARTFVEQLLGAASKARLDIVGMNVEPKSIIDQTRPCRSAHRRPPRLERGPSATDHSAATSWTATGPRRRLPSRRLSRSR